MKKRNALTSLSALLTLSFAMGLVSCGNGNENGSSSEPQETSESPFSIIEETSSEEPSSTHVHTYEATVVPPTCTEQGYTIHSCTTCEEPNAYVDSYVDPLGHDFQDYVSNHDATCTEDGTKTGTCSREGCGKKDTIPDVGSRLGHDYSVTWVWDGFASATATFTCTRDESHVGSVVATGDDIVSVVLQEPTCTVDGEKKYTASVVFDGETYENSKTETLDKLGHTYSHYVSNHDATCTEDGTKTATCDRCGEAPSTLPDADSKLGHDYSVSWTWDGFTSATATFTCARDESHVVILDATGDDIVSVLTREATCKTPGLRTYTASVTLGETVYTNDKTEVIDTLPHTWENNSCTVCGLTIPMSHGLKLAKNSDDTYYVSRIGECTDETIIIPATYNGIPITKIGYRAFASATSFSAIELPDTIVSIGEGAFSGCTSLTTINLPEGLTTLGKEAFKDCTSLTSIALPDSLTTFGASLFMNCTSLSRFTFPSELDAIPERILYGCTALTSIDIPETVTSIGTYSFYKCSGLTEVVLPEGLSTLDVGAFGYCTNLTTINLPDSLNVLGQSAFSSCSNLTGITLPEGLTEIGNWAFSECSLLSTIVVPDSVTRIGSYAFYKIPFTSLTLGSGITEIGSSCFSGGSIAEFVYRGTSTDWLGITFGDVYANPVWFYHSLKIGEETLTSLSVPEGFTEIKAHSFAGNRSLQSLALPSSVTSVGKEAFFYATSLSSLTLNEGLTSIGEYGFSDTALTGALTLPDSLQTLGNHAFNRVKTLTSVSIGPNLTSVAYSGFYGCDRLTMIEYRGTLDSWLSIAFGDVQANPLYKSGHITINGETITNLTLPGTLVDVPKNAFAGNVDLQSLTCEEGTMTIGAATFLSCSKLASVILPSSLSSVGTSAFRYCSSLAKVYYKGTAESFAAIVMGDYNESLTNATLYLYSESEPALNEEGTAYDGNYWHYDVDGVTPVVWAK